MKKFVLVVCTILSYLWLNLWHLQFSSVMTDKEGGVGAVEVYVCSCGWWSRPRFGDEPDGEDQFNAVTAPHSFLLPVFCCRQCDDSTAVDS